MTGLARYLLLAVFLAAAACSSAPPTSPVLSTPPSRYGAPEVANPRDVRPFVANPCNSLLSAAQLRELGLAATGRQRTIVTGEQECSWGSGTIDQSADIIVVPEQDILSATYRVRLDPVFEPTTVGDLPAVRSRGGATSLDCSITVGTGESQGFILNYYVFGTPVGEVPDDPCGRGERVAEEVVANLPPLLKN